MSSDQQPTVPICGIGASAGGVRALKRFFNTVDPDLGLAYVVIVHLSPDQPSVMDEILSTCTSMSVLQVEDGPTLKPNCVYVIAPDRELVIKEDTISSRPFSQPRGQRAPIDMFFRSIAACRGDGSAVVLSGSGSDGALGVKAVKEAGGIVFVQDPSEAEYEMMPQNAIATGVADFVAPVAELTRHLAEVVHSKQAVRSMNPDDASNELRRIINFLRARTGHDFASYKRATVMRRVMRRMQVARLDTLGEYAARVRDNPEEAYELFSDLLISVTMFFRDPGAFEVLAERTIPAIFDSADEGEGIRAWVAGCATGEEAYSLAILMREEAKRRKVETPIQIFASDLDEGALATAREGRYLKSIETDVSEERLRQNFVPEGTHYRVRKELRDMVLFAKHSVLKDPPFMRLDLISCRNLMIYLDRPLQQQLCSVFHYGLNPGGYLFLGSAETVDTMPDLFALVDRETRIYQAKPHVARRLPTLSQGGFSGPEPSTEQKIRHQHGSERSLASKHLAALEGQAPPSALVDQEYCIVTLSPSAGRFVQPPGGAFTSDLPTLVRPELRLDLKTALDHAFDSQEPSLTLPLAVAFENTLRRVALHVLPKNGEGHEARQALVFFIDGGEIAEPSDVDDEAIDATSNRERRLNEELKAAQERLAASRRDHDSVIEDLRAANEELQSINEEYRSTSEELETSKEELQSMNEELQTVNGELKNKLESISSAHPDLQNLTMATEIGTLFLDSRLRIKMFTPPVAELFNITDQDVGRTITDFTHHLAYDGIEQDAREVLKNLAPTETELRTRDGSCYMMRVRPYRTIDNRIDGVVLTFVDITARLKTERQLFESEEKYRTLFNSIDQGFCVIEMIYEENGQASDYRFLDVNNGFERQTGFKDPIGRTMRSLAPDHEEEWYEIYGRIAKSRRAERFEHEAAALDRYYEVYAFPLGEPDQHQLGVLFNDISDRKEAEQRLRLLVGELNHRVKNTLAVVDAVARQTFEGFEDHERFRTFEGRLSALAGAHALLSQSNWLATTLQDVAYSSALACGVPRDRMEISGPPIQLLPTQGVTFAMALHELCTNAFKYGALKNKVGTVDLHWTVGDGPDPILEVVWREQDGPRVEAPSEEGFGTMMLREALATQLNGQVSLDYRPEGLLCRIVAPLPGEEKTR
ncbi:chemotaxis protein CheB [Parvularcula oceani]|uniref:chemotaxis protein CheB n=1 Tax=Parvularcula oceani TaxID=1247963 RepID=UPI0004E1359B|nr:chemotaxis protein CheB [Parvularcula oceani]